MRTKATKALPESRTPVGMLAGQHRFEMVAEARLLHVARVFLTCAWRSCKTAILCDFDIFRVVLDVQLNHNSLGTRNLILCAKNQGAKVCKKM